MEVSGQLHAPAILPPGERVFWYPLARKLGGPIAGLDEVVKRKNPINAPVGNWTPVKREEVTGDWRKLHNVNRA
jgi:hypothetical protein